jgi:lipopolysaccharide export LptBFGC system permease protein LptF
MSFKKFLKAFLFIILLAVTIYFSIDIIQKKNNLMDIEEYSPKSSLVVEENPKK